MSRIRSKDTKPELVVRSALHQRGFRFSLHKKDLPGKPDIVLRKYNTIILVNGCFWHQHKNCKESHIPKSNKHYWVPKLERTIRRDKTNIRKLKSLGWQVIILWDCEIKNDLDKTIENIVSFLKL